MWIFQLTEVHSPLVNTMTKMCVGLLMESVLSLVLEKKILINGNFDGICVMFLVNVVDHHAESQPFTLFTVWFTSHKTAQHGVKSQNKWIPDLERPC